MMSKGEMRLPILIVLSSTVLPSSLEAQLAPPDERGVAFGHVHLYVESVEAHGRAWVDLLGVEMVERAGYTALRVPGSWIFLTEQSPTLPSSATVVDHIALVVSDLEEVLVRARGLGYQPRTHAEDGQEATEITLPDGVTLRLLEDRALSEPVEMGHVHMLTGRHEELGAWYSRIFAGVDAEGERSVEVPGATLRFTAAAAPRSRTHGSAIDHFGFEVTDIQAIASLLRREGVVFDTEPFYVESLDLWVAFFTDSSGARVEITEGLDHF